MTKTNLAVLPKAEEIDLSPVNTEFNNFQTLWDNYQQLKPIQQRALSLLISGKNISSTAKELEINRQAIYEWLQDELFHKVYELWQRKLMVETYHKQKELYEKALRGLDTLLSNPVDISQYFEVVKFTIENLKP